MSGIPAVCNGPHLHDLGNGPQINQLQDNNYVNDPGPTCQNQVTIFVINQVNFLNFIIQCKIFSMYYTVNVPVYNKVYVYHHPPCLGIGKEYIFLNYLVK